MKFELLQLSICLAFVSECFLTITAHPTMTSLSVSDNFEIKHRHKRQDVPSSTTARPKKRPRNIFSLFNVLFQETRDDTRDAFNEIGRLLNAQFAPATSRPLNNQIKTSTTSEPKPPGDEDNEIDGDVTTTTEPYRISREEFNVILRRNLDGIGRLFNRELRTAARDSGRNLIEFGRGFRESIRPFV